MSNRVLIGRRGTDYGLFISKPGSNVVTAPDADLIFNSNKTAWQVAQTGTILTSGGSNNGGTITYPDQGYIPVIIVKGDYPLSYFPQSMMDAPLDPAWGRVVWSNNTQAELRVDNGTGLPSISYVVFRIPLHG